MGKKQHSQIKKNKERSHSTPSDNVNFGNAFMIDISNSAMTTAAAPDTANNSNNKPNRSKSESSITGPFADCKMITQQLMNTNLEDDQDEKKQRLFKTEICRNWEETKTCRYGDKCQYAHGQEELRYVQRHPKYKTEYCRSFETYQTCPYGIRCTFLHDTVRARRAQSDAGQETVKQQAPTPPIPPPPPLVTSTMSTSTCSSSSTSLSSASVPAADSLFSSGTAAKDGLGISANCTLSSMPPKPIVAPPSPPMMLPSKTTTAKRPSSLLPPLSISSTGTLPASPPPLTSATPFSPFDYDHHKQHHQYTPSHHQQQHHRQQRQYEQYQDDSLPLESLLPHELFTDIDRSESNIPGEKSNTSSFSSSSCKPLNVTLPLSNIPSASPVGTSANFPSRLPGMLPIPLFPTHKPDNDHHHQNHYHPLQLPLHYSQQQHQQQIPFQ